MSQPDSIAEALPDVDRLGAPIRFRLLAALAFGWLLLAVDGFSNTACDFDQVILLLYGGLGLGVGWMLATCFALHRLQSWRDWAFWLAVPCAGLIGMLVAPTDVGLRCRFALSESALTERAESLLAGADASTFPSCVGLFWVRRAEVDQGVVYFYTSQSFINQEGLAYSNLPIGSPPRKSIQPLAGPWHRFIWRF
jgi:hypothetical protein